MYMGYKYSNTIGVFYGLGYGGNKFEFIQTTDGVNFINYPINMPNNYQTYSTNLYISSGDYYEIKLSYYAFICVGRLNENVIAVIPYYNDAYITYLKESTNIQLEITQDSAGKYLKITNNFPSANIHGFILRYYLV